MDPSSSVAEKYLVSRHQARQKAEATFIENHPEAGRLLALENEYVAGVMLSLSGKDFSKFQHGLYISDLIVSFTRTHFICQELVCQGELIEGAILLRKQMELLARLHELVRADKGKCLVGKTPHVHILGTTFKDLYKAYSAVAHSSDPIHLQQLGRIERNGVQYTPVYPVYDRNGLVTVRHQVLVVLEFHKWSGPYLSSVASDFDISTGGKLIDELARHYIASAQLEVAKPPPGDSH